MADPDAPEALTGRVEFNSEAGMFCAYGDRAALEQLGTAMAEIATDPAQNNRPDGQRGSLKAVTHR